MFIDFTKQGEVSSCEPHVNLIARKLCFSYEAKTKWREKPKCHKHHQDEANNGTLMKF